MKVSIASLGRFHVLDLARELSGHGVETNFHSYVPKQRAIRFGLPPHCHRAMLPYVAPLIAWQRYLPNISPALQERYIAFALDLIAKHQMQPSDYFICMSGIYLKSAAHAKSHGSQVVLERGSRHILSQKDILIEIGAKKLPSNFIVERELQGYELADWISVPSKHVVESFEQFAPEMAGKLFVNPYGVDLNLFPLNARVAPSGSCTAIFVGGWSKRKGADLLINIVRDTPGLKLLHVGGIQDVEFPYDDSKFQHVDPVPQWQLKNYYNQADVFVLASREEGLALVQAQALASGLPIVCTNRTGGADLGLNSELANRIFVADYNDANDFHKKLQNTINLLREDNFDPLDHESRSLLSWQAYGARYFEFLSTNFKDSSR